MLLFRCAQLLFFPRRTLRALRFLFRFAQPFFYPLRTRRALKGLFFSVIRVLRGENFLCFCPLRVLFRLIRLRLVRLRSPQRTTGRSTVFFPRRTLRALNVVVSLRSTSFYPLRTLRARRVLLFVSLGSTFFYPRRIIVSLRSTLFFIR